VSLLERLLWRWDHRRAKKRCERRGHDITGPHRAAGGWQVYICTRCPYRFRASSLI